MAYCHGDAAKHLERSSFLSYCNLRTYYLLINKEMADDVVGTSPCCLHQGASGSLAAGSGDEKNACGVTTAISPSSELPVKMLASACQCENTNTLVYSFLGLINL